MGSTRHGVYFLPGDYGTAEAPLQFEVGYYTDVSGLGATPGDVNDERRDRGLQPLPRRRRHEQLRRTEQLLAHDLEPVDSGRTRRARTDADGARTSGRSRRPSRCDACRLTGANLSLMDYCTAGPQYASGGFIADSDLSYTSSAARSSSGSPATARWPAGATASGTRCSRASSALRMMPDSRCRRTRRSTRLRSRARSRTCSSTTTVATTSACRLPRPTPAERRGVTAETAGRSIPHHGVLHRYPRRLGQGHQQRARARPAPDPHPRCLRHRSHDRGQACRHRRAGHGARDTQPRRRRGSARSEGCRRHRDRGSDHRRGRRALADAR